MSKRRSNRWNKSKNFINVSHTNSGILYLIPIIFVLCFIPYIVRFKIFNPNMRQFSWFWDTEYHQDIFLYYKQWALISTAVIMLLIILIRAYVSRNRIKFSVVFVPLSIYIILAILSAVFSVYSPHSFFGGFEQFESVLALISYGLIIYYAFLFIKSENDIEIVFAFLAISTLLMVTLGILQFLGYDFFRTSLGEKIIVPKRIRETTSISFNVPEGRVYLSLYNPNYVGSYTALLIPVFTILMFFQKKIHRILICLAIVVGLIICSIGSLSLTGVIAIVASTFFILVFTWRYLLKRFYIVIPAILLMIAVFLLSNKLTDGAVFAGIREEISPSKSKYDLEEMVTETDHVNIVYKGNELKVSYFVFGDQAIIEILDKDNKMVEGDFDPDTSAITITDDRFKGITVKPDPKLYGAFQIRVSGMDWRYIYDEDEGMFNYINKRGKVDNMINAPSSVFEGYEAFASGRGYIWSRTIPLIKDYIILGSGPDTFAIAFPQQDYMNLELMGFGDALLTKPHNMYLQIAIETGLLSLIAFLVFYAMYFVQSFRLYIRGRFTSYYSQVGVAIYIGTVAYMVTGLANDSSITTAPIFWTLMGIGIAVNAKAKPLILEERKRIKEEKQKSNSED